MQTTALIVQAGARRICLYYTGRRHAGENLEGLLTKREPRRDKPVVMSDALSQIMPRKRRSSAVMVWRMRGGKFSDLADDFPPRVRWSSTR